MVQRRPSLEEQLALLSRLRSNPDSNSTRLELKRSLGNRSSPLVARAAHLTGELGLSALAPDLVSSFHRFMAGAAKSDKGCLAKTAIAKALYTLEHPDSQVYLLGSRHRQLEPSYGPPVDTAVELRAISALALAAIGYPDVVCVLVDLLVDEEPPVRIAAVEALACCGRLEAEPLLRLKARQGDVEPEVVSECLAALLRLAPGRSLDFVATYLESADREMEAAALALGRSRLEAAFDVLRIQWERRVDRRSRKTLALALAMLRREPALVFLLSLVSDADVRLAGEVIRALAIHRHDERIRERVEKALAGRGDRQELHRTFEREFGR